jgi:hypothetical protein
MTTRQSHQHGRAGLIWTLLVLWAFSAGQGRADEWIDWDRKPVWPREFDPDGTALTSPSPASRPGRIRLFRIQPGFLGDPLGLIDTDDPADPLGTRKDADGPDWLQVSIGPDNPFLDVRRPGDPGGAGYYKVYTQVQLFETVRTGCAFGVQAVTPAGREWDGIQDGPTVVSPALSVFHTLADGTAFQGFVGKHVHLNPRWSGQLNQSVQYGMAVQRPLFPVTSERESNLYIFVETLGRYRYETDTATRPDAGNRPAALWEVLPGLHWRCNENLWISGGLILPVNAAPLDARLWQVTCSFRF